MLTGCKGPHEQGAIFKKNKPLSYKEDQFGNRIPDYSTAGYLNGAALPSVQVALSLTPLSSKEDDTQRIQDAIDQVSQFPINQEGFRGAILLRSGNYYVADQLRIEKSGVTLRGEGQAETGTTIYATGNQRRSLIVISGRDEAQEAYNRERTGVFFYQNKEGSSWEVIDEYLPSGTKILQVSPVRGLNTGDTVILEQHMNQEWINILGMDAFPPHPNRRKSHPWDPTDFVFQFERTIENIDGGRIHLNAPLVNPVFARFGSTILFKSDLPKRIEKVGVEQLRLVSAFETSDLNSDEAHGWTGVELNRVKNSWVRSVTGVHFGNATVSTEKESLQITIQDCAYLKPVAKYGYGRRHGFINAGQQILVQRCYTEDCSFPYFIPERTAGPNVFLDCYSKGEKAVIGPWRYWAMGTLWDNTYGEKLMIRNRGYEGDGWGWSGINHLFWNSTAFDWISVQSPINGWNWAIGCNGDRVDGPFQGLTGHVSLHGQLIKPRSLYMKQLEDRVGESGSSGVFTDNQYSGSVLFHIRDTLSEQ
ncbi:MAG: hypothetical protein O3C43_23520 [Verrucomicrobia bacterium]|nr:hypothetical protein [Verrucomicrobiota bacterium]